KNLTYKAAKDIGAFKIEQDKEALPIHCRPYSSINKPAVVVSLDHATASVSNYLSQVGDHDLVRMGSALKMCLVADGSADVYPRLGKTGEWDSGAGQVIVECAGGIVIDEQGNPLRYNTKESVINPNFIVIGDTSVDWLQYLTHSNSRDAAKAS
ncbi:MAG: 3'(2'),5'-bisphosphate nucleotidase CysQ, partial [Gammaproteobacteria bacterium]|nr:3'(2'),5'-bisphosphate nucleotidase CysQ [Gammaproteobacteria bacterium]